MSSPRSLLSRHPSSIAALLSTVLLSVGVVGFVSYADAATPSGPSAPSAGLPLPPLPLPTLVPPSSTAPSGSGSASGTASGTASGSASGSASTTGSPSVSDTPTPTITPTVTTDPDTAPTANAHVTPKVTFTGTVVTLSARGSADNETGTTGLTYHWNFDNGGGPVDSSKPNTTVTFSAKKIYEVTLTVIDPEGLTDSITVPVTVYKRVDCQMNGVSREGPWRVVSGAGAFGGKYCDNQGAGTHADPDSISTTFAGNLFQIDYGIAHGGGRATVYIDGVKKKSFSFGGKSTTPKFGHSVVLRNLGNARHQVRIEIKGGAFIDTFAY